MWEGGMLASVLEWFGWPGCSCLPHAVGISLINSFVRSLFLFPLTVTTCPLSHFYFCILITCAPPLEQDEESRSNFGGNCAVAHCHSNRSSC